MRRFLAGSGLVFFSTLAAAACQPASSEPRQPEGSPQRVVALAPSLADIAADVGGAGQLVGLSNYGRTPPGAEKAKRVGGFTDPSIEHVIALRPDLVLGVPLQRGALASCKAAGLRTLEVNCETLEDALAAYRTVGKALGHADEAATARRSLDERLESIRKQGAQHRPKRTLFLLGQAGEDLQQVYPVAPGNFANQLLEIAGGRNVIENAAPSISTESVIVLAPEVILEVSMDDSGDQGERRLPMSPLWSRLPAVPAVRDGQIHAFASSKVLQPGPGMADGAALLYRLLHGSQPASP